MPDSKVKCYSYIRWSSDQQASGSTLDRQLAYAREVAVENDLELVELIDEGVSAFKGRNLTNGELVDFINYQCTAEERQLFGIDDNMIRMSCGIENADDLVADLRQALQA